MSASNKIIQAAAGNAAGAVEPVGIDFDGTNDYLSRSSDLVGNTDSKTFTFSCWVYPQETGLSQFLYDVTSGGYFLFSLSASGEFSVQGLTSGASIAVLMETSSGSVPFNTWSHLLISVDLANNQGSIFINDVSQTLVTNTKNNLFIDSSRTGAGIAASSAGGNKVHGRLAGVYLDYTYRDLSVESNRRDFIDADGLYVTPPTSGIISLPMDDADDPGRNDGTGGDFTLNGIIAQSGRGPNQYNAAASTFDGSADYLSRTSLTGIADGKQGTFSCSFKTNTFGNLPFISFVQSGNQRFVIRTSNGGSFGYLTIIAQNSSGTNVLQMQDPSVIRFTLNKMHSLQVSFDLTDSNKRHIFVDGVEQTGLTYAAYTNDNIDYVVSNGYAVGATPIPNFYYPGEISDLYFDTSYMDLTSSNPFYDTETDKPKYLGASGELPTGSAPLIYLPLYANDAGNNLGTGGDFTVNSGPYTGARGPSEYWANTISKATDTGNFLNFGGPITASSTTGVAGFVIATGTPDNNQLGYFMRSGSNAVELSTTYNDVSLIRLQVTPDGSGGTVALDVDNYDPNNWNIIFFSCDTSGDIFLYVNGQTSSATSRSGNINLQSGTDFHILAYDSSSNPSYGAKHIGSVVFYDEHIDFSQEANRNLFVDQLGFPKDIKAQVDNGNINEPLILLEFKDSSNFGINSGSAGNFTVNGTIADGGYVKG